jgi:hypothetical protein
MKKNSVGLLELETAVLECFLEKAPLNPLGVNTELAIHTLDQVHCWGAYFRLGIGRYENFTPLNFQPLLFSKQ